MAMMNISASFLPWDGRPWLNSTTNLILETLVPKIALRAFL